MTLVVKNSPANAGDIKDLDSISGSGKSPSGGNDNPLQYSCLVNPTDRAAWWVTVHRVTKELDTTEAAAAAAKSLQSCPTLCDPKTAAHQAPVPGILQARMLEWDAISFSSAWNWKVKVKSLSRVWLFATPWTVAYQAPPSMGFSRQ